MPKIHSALITVTAALTIAGCANLKAGQELQAGRNALQTGHPEIALGYLVDAAATDPTYRIPFRFPEVKSREVIIGAYRESFLQGVACFRVFAGFVISAAEIGHHAFRCAKPSSSAGAKKSSPA